MLGGVPSLARPKTGSNRSVARGRAVLARSSSRLRKELLPRGARSSSPAGQEAPHSRGRKLLPSGAGSSSPAARNSSLAGQEAPPSRGKKVLPRWARNSSPPPPSSQARRGEREPGGARASRRGDSSSGDRVQDRVDVREDFVVSNVEHTKATRSRRRLRTSTLGARFTLPSPRSRGGGPGGRSLLRRGRGVLRGGGCRGGGVSCAAGEESREDGAPRGGVSRDFGWRRTRDTP